MGEADATQSEEAGGCSLSQENQVEMSGIWGHRGYRGKRNAGGDQIKGSVGSGE